jgi:segregation and condensation protein B
MSNTQNLNIGAQIEALLFFKGEPVSVRFLASTLKINEEDVSQALNILEESFRAGNRGIMLMRNGDEVTLGTVPEMGATIEALIKEELVKDLGKAGLETLATVLYRGPISRTEINYIRGVNSSYILRNLLVRGLIEKVENASARSTMYKPTFELLSYMGVSKVEDLPEYGTVGQEVETFKNAAKEEKENYEEDEVLDETV